MSEEHSKNGGIGFIGLLTIVFITLKLIGKIGWSWFWVLSPIWICVLLVAVIFVIAIIIHVIRNKIRAKRFKDRKRSGL